MKKLFVYMDTGWTESPELVGELTCDAVRGSETYGFAFDKNWLKQHDGIFLSEDLQNFTGKQYTQPGNEIFRLRSQKFDKAGVAVLKPQD